VSTPPHIRRGKFVRIASVYSTLIAVFLLSLLRPMSTMNIDEWANFALLLILIVGSGILAFAPSRMWRLALVAARVLWVVGVVMLIRLLAGAGELAWAEAGPALIISHGLVASLGVSVLTSATLVLWRDHTSRVRAR